MLVKGAHELVECDNILNRYLKDNLRLKMSINEVVVHLRRLDEHVPNENLSLHVHLPYVLEI
jgi:hypothetical protein